MEPNVENVSPPATDVDLGQVVVVKVGQSLCDSVSARSSPRPVLRLQRSRAERAYAWRRHARWVGHDVPASRTFEWITKCVSTPAGSENPSERPRPRPGSAAYASTIHMPTVDVEGASPEAAQQDVMNTYDELPSSKHMGRLPSQQPPDWKNITGPCWSTRWSMASSAVRVAITPSATDPSTHLPL